MKNKNLTGYLVDVLDDLSGPITISNTLDALYNVLNCDLIDITYLTLGEKEFCVIVDDEGLLKGSPKISAVSEAGKPMLVGNLLLVSADGGEDFASLTPDDIIQKQLKMVCDYLGFEGISTHSFRKFYATEIYKNSNYNIALVQQLLQHSSAAVTQRYIGIQQQEIERAIEGHLRLDV